ncbi:MAG TPA: YkgJ family cysteine cluster protein [Alphaproteobacteria bacterium]
MSTRDNLSLPKAYNAALSPVIKGQLKAIGERVRDLVTPSLDEARAADSEAAKREILMAAHTVALSVFESECLGYFHNVPGGLDLLNSLACRAGCTFCCELRVEVTALEAAAIWGELAGSAFEPVRQAVTGTGPRTQNLGDESRRQARIPCGLLKDGMCSVYASRPYACRGMFATSAKDCEAVMTAPAGARLPPVQSPAVPRALSAMFFVGVNAALKDRGLQHDGLELNSAVATLIQRPAALGEWLAGKKVFPVPALN